MIPRQRALAGLRLRNRDTVPLGEGSQRIARFAVEHAAARDDQRFARLA
jgi:hypothetical protein